MRWLSIPPEDRPTVAQMEAKPQDSQPVRRDRHKWCRGEGGRKHVLVDGVCVTCGKKLPRWRPYFAGGVDLTATPKHEPSSVVR